ncbi:hypothetical protein Dimus_011449, partial [Dionaea muscipula]
IYGFSSLDLARQPEPGSDNLAQGLAPQKCLPMPEVVLQPFIFLLGQTTSSSALMGFASRIPFHPTARTLSRRTAIHHQALLNIFKVLVLDFSRRQCLAKWGVKGRQQLFSFDNFQQKLVN